MLRQKMRDKVPCPAAVDTARIGSFLIDTVPLLDNDEMHALGTGGLGMSGHLLFGQHLSDRLDHRAGTRSENLASAKPLGAL